MHFLSIIMIIGVLTTFTDLKSKKIYNQHLAIGATLGVAALIYSGVFKHENILIHIICGIVAFIAGFILHRFDVWRGGDAKLFAIYSFLMPPPDFSHNTFYSPIALFANSFITGTIILLPGFLKDIIIHREKIMKGLFSTATLQAFFNGVVCAVFYSWVFFPFFYILRLTSPIVISSFIFLIVSSQYKVKKQQDNKNFFKNLIKNIYIEVIGGFIIGYLSRLLLAPNSLSFAALQYQIILITLSTITSLFIYSIFLHFKDYEERIPFAPLLFIGCMLSYTPFATWIAHLGR